MDEKQLLNIIRQALDTARPEAVNDVTTEKDGDVDQLVITVEGPEGPQVFVLGSDALCETDAPDSY